MKFAEWYVKNRKYTEGELWIQEQDKKKNLTPGLERNTFFC